MGSEPEKRIEYIHKKSFYVFPQGSKIFLNDNKLIVEVNNRKLRNISLYLSKEPDSGKQNYKIGLPITGEGSRLAKDYKAIAEYVDKYPNFNFLHFDYATSHDLALCTFFKPVDFNNLIQEIYKELPYLINIFRRPLIHLKEIEIIQPVDAAKRINRNTVIHLSRHSETWKNIDEDSGEIIPTRLLTRVYDDDYCIYENVVFRDLIEKILFFLRKRIFYFAEIFETFKDSIQLDPVNRFNHQMYYLAVGKLYVGFYKMEDSGNILAILENAKNLYKQISRYCNRPSYVKISGAKPISGEIKKTNILSMHKDYRHVYSLSKKIRESTLRQQDGGNYFLQAEGQQSYELFCQMLVLFAAGNFNTSCVLGNDIYSCGKINASFEFKDWKLNIKCENNAILGLNTINLDVMHHGKRVKYLFIPMGYYITDDRIKMYTRIMERLYYKGDKYDKYVFFEPFDTYDTSLLGYYKKHTVTDTDLFYAVLPISLSEINSFRRIQKLLFECLVFSDESREVCAFCGEETSKLSKNSCLCKKCRTAVKTIDCCHCKRSFIAGYANIKKTDSTGKKESFDDSFDGATNFFAQEKKYSFRNTVDIGKNGFVCPHCGGENSLK